MSVRVRFVLSGACHPSYSGKQIQLDLPLEQSDGSQTTTAHMKNIIRNEWPDNLPEMKEAVKTTDIKIIKTGNLLADDTVLRNVLTTTDITECSGGVLASRDVADQKSVLMHLVFQKNNGVAKREKCDGKSVDKANGNREVSNSNCCTSM